MSRCASCEYPFDEENGWQEFCSVTCAMCHIVGRIVTEDDIKANNKVSQRWQAWWDEPKNKRKVRLGEPAKKPAFGKFVKRQVVTMVNGREKVRIIDVNIGGEIKTRPITAKEKALAKARRGRGGWSDDMIDNQCWRDLPGQHGKVGLGWFPHDE